MKLILEQLFYGRGERGYGVLGESPGAAPFRKRVEGICGAVGTPTNDYGGDAFLLSVPDGGRVIMVCGRRGARDSMGRETLFFHVLVALKQDLDTANADAFSLFAQGAFAGRLPHGETSALAIEAKVTEMGGAASCHPLFPSFIRCEKPAPDAVRLLVGMDANERIWATFAFQTLAGFDVQVLPSRTTAPVGASEYDASGKLVLAAKAVPLMATEADNVRKYTRRDDGSLNHIREKPSAMLIVSLLANVILLALCAVLFVSRKATPPSPAQSPSIDTNTVVKMVETALSPEKRAAIENKAREAYRERLLSIAPTNKLREQLGFKGVAMWKGSKDVDEAQAFSTLLSIEALIKELTTPNKENSNP